MTLDEAKKALKKLGWKPGDVYRKRTLEDQKTIADATHLLALAGEPYPKPLKAAKKANKED
jgi:hypothetical protein